MADKRKGLGRGLGALMGDGATSSPKEGSTPSGRAAAAGTHEASHHPLLVGIETVTPNRYQPRNRFNDAPLDTLVDSIREHGIMNPLVVRPAKQGGYELIAGERRLRAAGKAGLKQVPVVVREVDDQKALELALIENLQREDLDAVEEAEGYLRLMDEFGLTQEQVATRVSKARATVANALRILNLSPYCKELLQDKKMSTGHAKALLALDTQADQDMMAKEVVRDGLSVRATEKRVVSLKKVAKKPRAQKEEIPQAHLEDLADRLQQKVGTAVRISSSKVLANGKRVAGRLEMDYYSADELDGILETLGLKEEW